MTKKELVFLTAERASVDKELVEKVLNAILNESKKAITSGKSVFIRGFGTLEPVIRRKKQGRISEGAFRSSSLLMQFHASGHVPASKTK
jgi:nucleoid DNA-binding protein